MGTVARRLGALIAVCALLIPAAARAGVTTYTAPYAMGPKTGDVFNVIQADPSTGSMTILRANPTGPSTGLGCLGGGGQASFAVQHHALAPVTSVVVSYTDALVDPYSWIDVAVRQGDNFVASRVERGILAAGGSVTVPVPSGVTGDIEVWFGLQVSSACPNVDGAHATFASVAVAEA